MIQVSNAEIVIWRVREWRRTIYARLMGSNMYRKVEKDDGNAAFVIAGFAIFSVIVILLGMMF